MKNINRIFEKDEELEFKIDDKKISGWFESINDDVITLKIFKDEYWNLKMNDFVEIHIDYLFDEFEEKFKKGYEEYLKLPKAGLRDSNENELYKNHWCLITGLGVVSPNPHRHYSFLEFVFHCGRKIELFNRFIR